MQLKYVATPVLLVFLALDIGGSEPLQPPVKTRDLPAGGWLLMARESGHALLAPKSRRNAKAGEKGAGLSAQVLVIAPGAAPALVPARVRGLFVPGPNSRPQVWSTQFAGRQILFNPAGNGPALQSVAGKPGDYVFAADGTVWSLRTGGAPRKLAADSMPGFSRKALALKAAGSESEGEGGLIWAAGPLASPDGRSVVYVTNREAIQARTGGQSVWLVDETGRERALLAGSGAGFSPLAWLGKELLFTGDDGGLSAIDPASGRVRRVSGGTLLAVDPARGIVASLEGDLPGDRKLLITRPKGRSRVARPAGLEYAGSADFSPNGLRLAVVLSDAKGRKQIQIIDVYSGNAEVVPLPATRQAALVDPPRWVDDQTLLITTGLRGTGEERSSLLSVPVSAAR